MKKTKLFTSIAALALVLGLGACETTSEEEEPGDEPSTSVETDEGTESGEGGEKDLVFGFELEDGLVGIDGGTVIYNEKSYDYEGTYTTNLDEAVRVNYEAGSAVGEYYLSFELDGVTRWITITEGDYTNLSYATEKAPLYYNPTYGCWGNEKQTHFLCYNAAYDCLYSSSITGTPKDSDVPYIETSPIAGLYYTDGSKVTGFVGDVYQEPGLGYEIPEPNIGVDTTYRLGALIDETTYRFFNGATTGSTFLGTTQDWDEAAEVYITAIPDDGVTNSCTLSIVVGEELKYISNNNSTSVTLADDPCIWVWVESLEVFAQGSEEGRVLVYYASSLDFRGYAQNDTNLAYPHVHAYEQVPEGYEPPSEYEIPEPNVGSDSTYKLGCLDTSDYMYKYLDGGVSGNYLTVTSTWADGKDFYITAIPDDGVTNSCTISYYDETDGLKYLSLPDTSKTTLQYDAEPTIWVWNETEEIFAQGTASGRFLCYTTSYGTVAGYAQSTSNLANGHIVAYSTEPDPYVPEPVDPFTRGESGDTDYPVSLSYSYEFVTNDKGNTTESTTHDLNGLTWTFSAAPAWGFENSGSNRGLQIGTSGAPAKDTAVTLSTNFGENVKLVSLTINSSVASASGSGAGTITTTFGGETVQTIEMSASNGDTTPTDYSAAELSVVGQELTISVLAGASNSVYIKSVSFVLYATAETAL